MFNVNDYAMKTTQHNLKRPYIPDHPYRILIIGRSGSGKTNALLNKPPARYICMLKIHIKLNTNFLINKRESTGLKLFNDPKN